MGNTNLYKMIVCYEDLVHFMSNRKSLPIPIRDKDIISNLLENYLWDYCRKLEKKTTLSIGRKSVKNNTPWYINHTAYCLGIPDFFEEKTILLCPFDKEIRRVINISYLEDEYYLAKMVFNCLDRYIKNPTELNLYFKCDSLDGLIEFIADLNNGII